jgi:PrcB C-terminal
VEEVEGAERIHRLGGRWPEAIGDAARSCSGAVATPRIRARTTWVTLRRLAVAVVIATASGSTRAVAQHDLRSAPVAVSRLRESPTAFSSYANLRDPIRTVIRDSTTWRRFWERINRPFVPPPALPSIDFDREMIVAAGLGTRPSGGYDVVIEGAEQDSAGVQISVRVATPATGCPVSAVTTQPIDLARIPATDQPVRFRERGVVVACAPP